MNNNARCRGCMLDSFPDDFVVLDLETTGLSPVTNEIIEIGMMRVVDNKVVDSYDELVRPENAIAPFISSLTGITNEMVADKPPIEEVLPSMMEFAGDSIIVGHNVMFDIGFVYENVLKCRHETFYNDFVDTLRMSRKIVKGLAHYRLCDMVEHYNIERRTAHRALSDVAMTYDLYECLRHDAHECK